MERYTPEENEELKTMALKTFSHEKADRIAELFVQKYPSRTFDAVKQKVFKFRRDSLNNVTVTARKPRTSQVTPVNQNVIQADHKPVEQKASNHDQKMISEGQKQLVELELPSGIKMRGTSTQVLNILKGLQNT